MNKNQVDGRAQQAKGKTKEVAGKVTGDKSTEFKGKAEKHGGKFQAEAHSSKDGAVLGEINDDARKENK